MATATASESQSAPAFVAVLLADRENAKKVLEFEHPDYAKRKRSWEILRDAYEASGGFLDGTYLWPYPRESQEAFDKRREMARYHNYVESLVDLYVRFVQTQGVSRNSKNEDFKAWLKNVDGKGASIDAVMRQWASLSLVHGHAGALVDKTKEPPKGPAKSDEQSRPILSLFNALAIQDWRFNRDDLVAVKLREAAAAPLLTDDPAKTPACQYLLWTVDGWARFSEKGELLDAGTPGLDRVPFTVLRPKPSYTSLMIGRALVPNANIVRAMFNRTSEEDNVIRDQAFSLAVVEVPPDGDTEKAKQDLGNKVGTSIAVVVRGKFEYKTPDQSVPATIRNNVQYLVQEMYRAAHVRFANDSREAQSGESIRLQNTELNEMLQGLGTSMQQAELDVARNWFAWQSQTPEAAAQAFEAAHVEVAYPKEFFLDALIDDLTAWAEAIRLGLGGTMTRRIKKRVARRVDPEMPPDVQKIVEDEIDKMPDEAVASLATDTGDAEGDAIDEAARA